MMNTRCKFAHFLRFNFFKVFLKNKESTDAKNPNAHVYEFIIMRRVSNILQLECICM